jgi:hypothetical protein
VALLLVVAPAAARTIKGGPSSETLKGTATADRIYGRGGDDSLRGRAGNDLLIGGAGDDRITGGPGRDRINCGPGRDVAVVDRLDRLAANCEMTRGRVVDSAPVPTPTLGPTATPPPPRAAATPTPPAPEGSEMPREEEGEGPEEEAEGAEEESEGEEEDGPGEESENETEEEQDQEVIPGYEELPLATFPEGHGWTGNGVGDFGDAGPPFVVDGNDRSYKIQTDGEGDDSIATSPPLAPVDLTAAHVSVLGLVSYSNYLGKVRLRLSSGDIETDYAEATLWDGDQDPTVLGTTFEYQSVPRGGFDVHGTVDWSRIDRAQLIVTDNGAGPVFYYAAGIYAVPTYRTPTVSFAFDDSLESTFTMAASKLGTYSMPATEYVIADAVGEPGFLTESQLLTMSLDGWEIGGHAATLDDHNEPNGLDSLDPRELEEDFDTMREWMSEHGFAQRTFAYPKGAAGAEAREYAERDYCAARVTADGPETLPPRNPFVIRGFSINSAATHLAQLEREVDKAIAEKSWLVLTFHRLVRGAPAETTDFNYAEFAELVDYVHARQAEGTLQVKTVADAVGC